MSNTLFLNIDGVLADFSKQLSVKTGYALEEVQQFLQKELFDADEKKLTAQDCQLKNKIEKAFLRNRISYFIRWDRESVWQKMFGRKNSEQCKICINDWDKELALEILKKFEKDIESQGEMLSGRTESSLQDTYVHK